ncbi:hypothetical protein AB0J42_19650 [Nonomuraea sp. NPDC049649]|uniref:hypothetical protein n=1 Tax=Nonomuraea sp. NPDC049649 TaxID=3155776 RepID=UPI003428F8A0
MLSAPSAAGTNCATAMQRAVRPEHVGRGAGLWQLTILPVVGIAAVALMRTSKMVLPRQAAQ